MKRSITAESGIKETRNSHKDFGLTQNKSIVIDADAWYQAKCRRQMAEKRHQAPVIIAREDAGVILA